jgi:triosephosphate isomerase
MKSRQITVIANWKANLPPSEEVALAKAIAQGVGDALQAAGRPANLRLLLAPSALGLVPVASLLRREYPEAGVEVAAQDASLNSAGAFTGEIPADHLVGIAPAVLVGHSERRRDHAESDEVVGGKLARVVAAGLAPVLCLGDDLPKAEIAARVDYVQAQCAAAFAAAERAGCSAAQLYAAGLVIAYEPVWAIGTGNPASVEIAEAIASGLRSTLNREELPVLYGGSVDAASAATWFGTRSVRTSLDGLLVGGASLSADRFVAIVRAALAVAEPA